MTGDADEKSPKSAPKLSLCFLLLVVTGAVVLGFGGGAGLASKKLPPLSDVFWVDACRECPDGEAKFAKGEDFC